MNLGNPTELKDLVDIAQGSVTILAILAGGAWGYLKVVRGRLYRPRLEPTVSGRLLRVGDVQLAVVTLSVENVGLSRVQLHKPLSTLEIEAYSRNRYLPKFHRALPAPLGVINVLQKHEWVEPGECINDEEVVALPQDELLALIFKFRLVQQATPFRSAKRSTEWNAVAVADIQALFSEEDKEIRCPSKETKDEAARASEDVPTDRAAKAGGRRVRSAPGGTAPTKGAGRGTAPEAG